MTGDNEPWLRDGWVLPPRCCGTYADNPHSCSICGERPPVVGANVTLGSE